jgi:ribosomal protein L30/L7E
VAARHSSIQIVLIKSAINTRVKADYNGREMRSTDRHTQYGSNRGMVYMVESWVQVGLVISKPT